MQQTNFTNYASFKNFLWIVFIAISSSLVLIASLSIFIAPQIVKNRPVLNQNMTELFLFIDFVVLLLIIPGINFIYRKLLQQNLNVETLSGQLNGYLQSKIIVWAIIEAIGIFIIVQFMLSNYIYLLLLFIGVVYLMLRNAPGDREIRSIFQISASEIDKALEKEKK
ncbi:MAG: hypothetical protein KAR38_16125 [Calditrichia bacterium]|nr:hypothetical protein [Calditrichia bacterium]